MNLTDERETLPPIPARWSFLTDETGGVDGFLLTPLGRERGRDFTPSAFRGGYGGGADPADAVLAVWQGDEVALVTLDPIQQVSGRELSGDDLATITAYIGLNKAALMDHWAGRTSSLSLIRALRVPD